MRILTANLRHGGGTRVARLAAAVISRRPDVAVISEFRANDRGEELRAALTETLPHSTFGSTGQTTNAVAIFSHHPFAICDDTAIELDQRHRWIEVKLPGGLDVVGLYVPGSAQRRAKVAMWDALVRSAPRWSRTPTVVIGDLNTGRHRLDETGATFTCADRFEAFARQMTDAWRTLNGPDARDYSWYSSHGNGFRLDHSFVSPMLAEKIRACRYLHEPRLQGLTDHAMLELDLDPVDPPG